MTGLLDLHACTMASSHAYSSLYGMVRSASAKGLSLFGCSNHVPAMSGSCHSFHFINFKALPRTPYGVRLIMGVELSIMNYDETVDLEQSVLKPLDYVIANLHQPCIHSDTALQNTNAYLGAFRNPLIHIIERPDDSCFPIGYGILVAAAGEHRKLLEVNNSSLNSLSFRVEVRSNYIEMLELCRHYSTSIIINSDTHCESDAGNHAFAHALLEEANFPRGLMVNTSLDRLCYFLPEAAAILTRREDERCGRLYRPITTEEGNAPGGSESRLIS